MPLCRKEQLFTPADPVLRASREPESAGRWDSGATRVPVLREGTATKPGLLEGISPTGDCLPGFRRAAWFLRRMQEMKTLCECSRLYPPGSVCRKVLGIDPGLSVSGVYVPA